MDAEQQSDIFIGRADMTTNLALATITATDRLTSRSFGDRFSDSIYNVMDFGALGDFSGAYLNTRYGTLGAAQADYPFVTDIATQTIDWAAIQAAINAMWASSSRAGTVFIPVGGYIVRGNTIDISNHEIGSANTNGRILGAARSSTFISGNINNGFVFSQDGTKNGPEEISHLTVDNGSTWIGSGGIRLSNSTICCTNVSAGGMIAWLFSWNIYNASLINCNGGCPLDATTGYNGTLGFAGFTTNIKGWRTTRPMMAAIQVSGANSSHIDGCGIENCVTALLLGSYTGWASHCTIAPEVGNPGYSILTIPTDTLMGSGDAGGGISGHEEFQFGDVLFGRGLALPAWGSDPNDTTGATTITGLLTGVGWQGTYRINGEYTITTPIPIWTRRAGPPCAGITVSAIQTEACFHSIYLNSVSGCHVSGSGFGSNPVECVNQDGEAGLTPRAPFYVKSASATTISGVGSSCAASTLAGFYIADGAYHHVTIESCNSNKGEDNITTGFITDDVMTITAFTSGVSCGVGMTVTGSGVASNTVITDSLVNDPLTETFTVTIASPGVFTTLTPHGFSANDQIMLYNGGANGDHLPTGLAIRTIYYVITAGMTATTFKLSASAGPGSAIDTSGSQQGTHYISRLDGSTGLSGYSNTGTWRVSPGGQSATSTTLTVHTATDWVIPTSTYGKTGLKLINCTGNGTGLDDGVNMTFTSLPGEAGASIHIQPQEGQEFNIVDGAKSGGGTAAFGDACQGGGSQHIKVWWNGTDWIRCG